MRYFAGYYAAAAKRPPRKLPESKMRVFPRQRSVGVSGLKNIPRPGEEVSSDYGSHGTSPRIFCAVAYTSSTPIISIQRRSVGQTGFRQGPQGTS